MRLIQGEREQKKERLGLVEEDGKFHQVVGSSADSQRICQKKESFL